MSVSGDSNYTLGNYKLVEVLGMGAMGYVYRARQINLDRDVAVKILLPKLAQESGYLDLFFREARTAAALEHPHIVPVFDYGVQQNVSYVAMRLLLGGSLGERIQHRLDLGLPLPSLPEIIGILNQAASALDYAHARGVIHRDIKPTNLMFDQHGIVYVVDFGIAKLIGTTSSINGGTFLGTPSFMAPEQWEGLAPTPAVDQYALGAVIYMMLTGHPPFESDVPLALMSKHLNEVPQDVCKFRPDLPAQVNHVLLRALAKQSSDRFPSVAAFSQAFTAAVQDTAGENPTGFTTYALPQTSFSLPFLTLTVPPIAASSTESAPTPPIPPASTTLRSTAERGRNLILWVESVLLILAVALIFLLLLQRSGIDPPPSPSLVSFAGTQTPLTPPLAGFAATQTPLPPPDDPTVSSVSSKPSNALLVASATSTLPPKQTQTFTATASDTPTFTATSTPLPSSTPTATETVTFTPSFTSTFTPTQIVTTVVPATEMVTFTFTPSEMPTETPTATATPTDTPTMTLTSSAPRPTVNWRAGYLLKVSNPNGAWLRARASTSALQVATLAYNNPVTATGRNFFDGRQWWWEVRASWGAVGWVEQYSLTTQ